MSAEVSPSPTSVLFQAPEVLGAWDEWNCKTAGPRFGGLGKSLFTSGHQGEGLVDCAARALSVLGLRGQTGQARHRHHDGRIALDPAQARGGATVIRQSHQ